MRKESCVDGGTGMARRLLKILMVSSYICIKTHINIPIIFMSTKYICINMLDSFFSFRYARTWADWARRIFGRGNKWVAERYPSRRCSRFLFFCQRTFFSEKKGRNCTRCHFAFKLATEIRKKIKQTKFACDGFLLLLYF